MKENFVWAALVVGALAFPRSATAVGSATPEYSIQDLGVLDTSAETSYGRALTDGGQVVGMSWDASVMGDTSFIWTGNTMSKLPHLRAAKNSAAGINNQGEVTLNYSSRTNPEIIRGGVAWDINTLTTNEPFPLTEVKNINNWSEMLVGGYDPLRGQRTFLWRDQRVEDIGDLGGGGTWGQGMNDQAEIVGYSTNAARAYRPFLWRQGKIMDLGLPYRWSSSPWAMACGINNREQVVGYVRTPTHYLGDAVIWERDTTVGRWTAKLLDESWYGTDGTAIAINDSGVVIGIKRAGSSYQPSEGFVWTSGKGIRPLSSLIPLGTDWITLHTVTAINAKGQITGQGRRGNGLYHAFLLTPITR